MTATVERPTLLGSARGDELVTVREAAERLRLGETLTRGLIKSGQLPTVRFGRAIRIRVTDLDELIERSTSRVA